MKLPRFRRFRIVLLAAFAVAGCSRTPGDGYPDFSDLVDQVSPSVVNISTISESGTGDAQPTSSEAPEQRPFGDFFKKFFDEQPGDGVPDSGDNGPDSGDAPDDGEGAQDEDQLPEAQSLGSGFVLWADGYILTNAHVVSQAREILVRLSDRREMPAKLVGTDERSDLALLKIDADNLPAIRVGDVSKLRVGQWVLAIGSPFGFDHSVTAGIVSAKGRALPSENYVPFLQTDVAINPGNSGGPLFNTRGEVVGVNSQIFSQTGGYMGVSFSIPIDVASKVAQQLKDKGKVTRGWLGVVVQEVTRELAQSFDMKTPEGALVARVLPGSPAEEAGIKPGDVILTYDGQKLPVSSVLPPLVGNTDPGKRATLEVLRDGKTLTIKVEVGALEGEKEAAAQPAAPKPANASLGITVKPLTAEQRRREQVVSGGALVVEVGAGPARDAGLREGDVILTIAGNEVDSQQRLEEVLGRLGPGQSVPMLVQRNGSALFLALEPPAKPNG